MESWDVGWRSISLLSERAERIITAEVYVFPDSILCQGERNNSSTANEAWRITSLKIWMERFEWYRWKKEGICMDNLSKIHNNREFKKSKQCEPEEFEGRIIFMSMFSVIEWRQDDAKCILKSFRVARYAHRLPRGHWSFLGLGLEKTWYRTCTEKPNGEWDGTAASMILQMVTESRHSNFRASSAFERRELDFLEYG